MVCINFAIPNAGNVATISLIPRYTAALRKMPKIPELTTSPFPLKPRQAAFAGEQFLHRALFDLALFDEELLQGFNEGIRITQRPGNGFLFRYGGWECNFERPNILGTDVGNCGYGFYAITIGCEVRTKKPRPKILLLDRGRPKPCNTLEQQGRKITFRQHCVATPNEGAIHRYYDVADV